MNSSRGTGFRRARKVQLDGVNLPILPDDSKLKYVLRGCFSRHAVSNRQRQSSMVRSGSAAGLAVSH